MQKTRLLICGGALVFLLMGVGLYWIFIKEDRFKIVFCDVGQGDATLVMYKDFQVLIDAGPDVAVLDCLEKHLRFDKKIEFAIITHADKDHYAGMVSVLGYYSVEHVAFTQIEKYDYTYVLMLNQLKLLRLNNKTKIHSFFAGDVIRFGEIKIRYVWPTVEYVRDQMANSVTDDKSNQLSSVLHIQYEGLDVLISGDADSEIQPQMLLTGLVPRGVEIATAPHHGSRTGLTNAWMQHVRPALVIVSSGKNNVYGHPAEDILEQFNSIGAEVYRTDAVGDVEFIYDNDKLMQVKRN